MSESTGASRAGDTGDLMDSGEFGLALADPAHPEAGWRFTRPAAAARDRGTVLRVGVVPAEGDNELKAPDPLRPGLRP